jgi:hypothetical protein
MEELEIDASKIRTRQDWIKPVGQRAFVWQVHTPSMVWPSLLSIQALEIGK